MPTLAGDLIFCDQVANLKVSSFQC
eukprot:COSAG04_NODE_19327_length_419_cov_0.481250_3_plen_24_part_01